MALETKPCPVCGKDLMVGYEHPECLGIDPKAMARRTGDRSFSFPAGTDLSDVLRAMVGGGFYVQAEQFDYTWDGGSLTVNITELLNAIQNKTVKHERFLVDIDVAIVETLIANQSVELDHCNQLTKERLEEPVIFIKPQEDAEGYILADGQHRYVAKWACDHKDVRAYIVEFRDWQPYGRVTKN